MHSFFTHRGSTLGAATYIYNSLFSVKLNYFQVSFEKYHAKQCLAIEHNLTGGYRVKNVLKYCSMFFNDWCWPSDCFIQEKTSTYCKRDVP